MNQYRLTPEQAIEQDARYYNPDDYDEKLAFDLDPDRHTPAEFWSRPTVAVAPVVPSITTGTICHQVGCKTCERLGLNAIRDSQ